MTDRNQGAGLSSGSSAAVHKAHWTVLYSLFLIVFQTVMAASSSSLCRLLWQKPKKQFYILSTVYEADCTFKNLAKIIFLIHDQFIYSFFFDC